MTVFAQATAEILVSSDEAKTRDRADVAFSQKCEKRPRAAACQKSAGLPGAGFVRSSRFGRLLQKNLNCTNSSRVSTAEPFNSPGVADSEAVKEESNAPVDTVSKARWDLIQLCVHVTRLVGIPRSTREIFGFVFSSPSPVTFEDIVGGLAMSNGSASYGLRYLRRIGAITVTYLARDRRDYYIAEASLARLVCGYLMENISYHLADNRERICSVRAAFGTQQDLRGAHLSDRVELLLEWNRQIGTAIAAANEALLPRPGVRE